MNIAHPSSLDLFGRPATQIAIKDQNVIETRPIIAPSKSDDTVTFNIQSASNECIEMSEIKLKFRMRVKASKLDGEDVKPMSAAIWQNIIPIQCLLNSYWRQIDLKINEHAITNSQQLYAFKSNFDIETGYSKDAKEGLLSAAGYSANRKWFEGESSGTDTKSKWVEFYGKLMIPLFYQNRALPAGTKLSLICTPHTSPNFYLINSNTTSGTERFEISTEVEELILEVPTLVIDDRALSAQREMLKTCPAIYPFTNSDVRVFPIPSEKTYVNFAEVCTGTMPTLAIVSFLNSDQFVGDIKTDPFVFKHHNLEYLCFHRNGRRFPSNPMKPNFDLKHDMREMYSLYSALRQTSTDSCLDLKRSDWRDSKMMLAVNFTPECSQGCLADGHRNASEAGVLSLELQFKTGKTKPALYCLVYMEFESELQINGDKTVKTSWI